MSSLWPTRQGVHFDAGRIAMAEVRKRGGRIRLLQHEIAYLTDRVLIPDPFSPGIRDEELVQKTLRTLLKPGRRSKRVSVSLSDLIARVTLIPMEKPISHRAEAEKLIRWKIEKGSLHQPQQLRLRYQVCPGPALPDRKTSVRKTSLLLASAVPEPVLHQYEAVLQAGGLEPRLIDIASFHVFNLYHDHLLQRSAPHHHFIFLYAGDSFSTVMIFSGGVLNFIRIKALRSQTRSAEDKIIEELRSSLAFYNEDHDMSVFTHLFLVGLPISEMLSKSLGDSFSWEIVQLKPEDVISITPQGGEVQVEDWPVLIPAIAAAVGR
jgi:Tfp pilus assembly PilM family ATPase